MAKIVWTEPALSDLEAIADYIEIENPRAAADLVQRVFRHVEQLRKHPRSSSEPPELERSKYRQIIEQPCRVLYRYDGKSTVYILHILRFEQSLRKSRLA